LVDSSSSICIFILGKTEKMNIKKENAIHGVIEKFGEYSNLILHQITLLEKVFSSGTLDISKELLDDIKKNEEKSDQFEIKLSEKIIDTIVLQQPLASDLRKLMACYQMVINLERIGDLVVNIINFIPKIKDREIFSQMTDVIYNMLIIAKNMVQKSILSFTNSDREYAVWTIKNDSIVDEMNQKLVKKAISRTNLPEETRQLLLTFIHINSIISNIERMADHATNVAEASVYALDGTDIRHQHHENESI
jgi:phosphate transport system protein